MTKETTLSILRHLLTAAGAFLIGKHLAGQDLTDALWQSIVGALAAISGIIWSFKDKTVTMEGFQGVVRQVLTVFGGLMVGAGYLTNGALESISGAIIALLPLLQGHIEKTKTQQLLTGHIALNQLKGARPEDTKPAGARTERMMGGLWDDSNPKGFNPFSGGLWFPPLLLLGGSIAMFISAFRQAKHGLNIFQDENGIPHEAYVQIPFYEVGQFWFGVVLLVACLILTWSIYRDR
jgi:hypothetical protein